MSATAWGTFSSSMNRIGHNYGQLRASRESFFVRKRSLHIFGSEGGIFANNLLDTISSLVEAPYGGCRDASPRYYRRVVYDMLMPLDAPELVSPTLAKLLDALLNVLDHVDYWKHCELAIPH